MFMRIVEASPRVRASERVQDRCLRRRAPIWIPQRGGCERLPADREREVTAYMWLRLSDAEAACDAPRLRLGPLRAWASLG